MGNVLQRPAGALNSDEYIILVGNIPWRGRWQDLKDLVREITPNVQRVEIYLTQDGRSRGFGYIIVKEREEATRVVDRLDGFEWHGRALMVKLGNEANPVPVLAQPTQTSTPENSNILAEYKPVPPLPSDYSTNTDYSPYSNLAPSQVAAYNEWIAIQAFHHYSALAYNTDLLLQEERNRHQNLINQQLTDHSIHNALSNLSLVEPTSDATAVQVIQDREAILEEYKRQAELAQRTAAFHSTRHHILLQEERSRVQEAQGRGIQSSSSSSPRSSSSPFSLLPSGRGTPNQPSNSKPLTTVHSSSSSQSTFTPYHYSNPTGSSTTSLSTLNYYPQRTMSEQQSRRGSYPFPQPTPEPSRPSQYSAQGHAYIQYPPASMQSPTYGYTNMATPSFNPNILPGYQRMHQVASPTSITTPHHFDYNGGRQHHIYYPTQQRGGGTSSNIGHRGPPPAAIPPTPVVFTSPAGMPVNLTTGAVQTESRGIFIGNLPYNTNWRDLRAFLAPAGHIVRCDVPRKPNNKGRGYATVLFRSADDAARACELFNGTTFEGRQIRVRLDTYANTKPATREPTVGSGSAASGASGSGENQLSFYTDGDMDPESQTHGGGGGGGGAGGRKSAASV